MMNLETTVKVGICSFKHVMALMMIFITLSKYLRRRSTILVTSVSESSILPLFSVIYTKPDLTGLSYLTIGVMAHGQATVKLPYHPLDGARDTPKDGSKGV